MLNNNSVKGGMVGETGVTNINGIFVTGSAVKNATTVGGVDADLESGSAVALGQEISLNCDTKDSVIKYSINDSDYNRAIIINGVNNTLTYKTHSYYNNNTTFDYVISSNEEIEELNIEFYEGTYYISDIEVYTIDNEFFDKNNTTPLEIDFDKTKGDDIYGSIDVLEDGYFIFTIPYDKGYTIYVDNKEVEIEQVSGGFIGFKINKGNHDIHLTFKAPYARLGRIVSLIGIIILIILSIYERKKDNNVIIGGDV